MTPASPNIMAPKHDSTYEVPSREDYFDFLIRCYFGEGKDAIFYTRLLCSGEDVPSAPPNGLVSFSGLDFVARTAFAANMAGEASVPVRVEPRHGQYVGPEVAVHPSRLGAEHFQLLDRGQ